MGTEALQIIDAVRRLPLSEKMHVIELIFRDIRGEVSVDLQEEEVRKKAAELLLEDYQTDEELISFTSLDQEDFYEAK